MIRGSRRLVLGVSILGLLAACSSSGDKAADPEHAKAAVKDSGAQLNQRTIALEEVWTAARNDPSQLPAAREASKTVLWKGGAPSPLRVRAIELLMTDTSPEGLADTRKFLRLRMPTESQWPVIEATCTAIAKQASDPAWQEMTAALVRSYARRVDTPADPERPERRALEALHPGAPVADTVYGVFVHPAENGALKVPDDYVEKSRQAAWELLGRLDTDGSQRQRLLAGDSSGDPLVRDLSRCARELGVVPLTGSELQWLRRLTDDKDKANAAWWDAAQRAVASLTPEQRRGLQMRHLEPVRFAVESRPEWARATREQLLSELSQRLSGRRIHLKTEGLGFGQERSRETLAEWQKDMAWGDVLTALILDDAVHEPGVMSAVFTQVAKDQADTTSEHGGVLWAAGMGGEETKGRFAVRGYQPRPTQRVNDREFLAPEQMFADSARALAHYHFHVQSWNNRDYAGPGRGDLDYANAHGRNCLVFTGVGTGVLDVDYYLRGGVVIDLGEIGPPR